MPAASAPQAVSAPAPAAQTFQFALPNGMQVLVIPDHRAPVVTQMLWFKVGAVDDPPGISGLAHFFEHMMFRGTKQMPGDLYAQTIAKNGGEDNAFTTHDYTAFYEQIAADRLKLAMDLEADRMANLDLSDSNVTTERDVVLEERRMRVENNPQALMGEQMEAALHHVASLWPPRDGLAGRSAPHRQGFGAGFLQASLRAQQCHPDHCGRRHARSDPRHGAGRIRQGAARPLAAAGGICRAAAPDRNPHDLVRADVQVPLFERIYRVPSYAQAAPGQAESFETLAQIMGGDQTAMLYRVLVEEKKLATDAGASYDGYARDAGEFSVYAVPRAGVSLETLEKAVDQVMQSFARCPSRKASDLARAKTELVASVTYRRDSQFAMASAYGQALMIGLTVDDVNEWPARIRAVDAAGVQKAAQRLFRRNAVSAYLVPGAAK